MTVIDYLPVGEGSKAKCSAQPDKKVYYFKGHGMHYSLLLQVHLDKHQNNSAMM